MLEFKEINSDHELIRGSLSLKLHNVALFANGDNMITALNYFSRNTVLTREEEDAFFSTLKNSNKTFKKTLRGRLHETDCILADFIKLLGKNQIKVLDVGVSSGTTCIDLASNLKNSGIDAEIVGTDISIKGTILEFWPGCFRALTDSKGHILQFDLCGHPFRAWQRRADFISGYVLVYFLLTVFCRILPYKKLRDIELISNRVSKSDFIVSITEDNIMDLRNDFVNKFDVIRIANLMNLSYFSESQISKIIQNISKYFNNEEGLLLVVRTDENENNNGSIFIKTKTSSFEVLSRFGRGSEAENIIVNF